MNTAVLSYVDSRRDSVVSRLIDIGCAPVTPSPA
jgi:hypothetical protein